LNGQRDAETLEERMTNQTERVGETEELHCDRCKRKRTFEFRKHSGSLIGTYYYWVCMVCGYRKLIDIE